MRFRSNFVPCEAARRYCSKLWSELSRWRRGTRCICVVVASQHRRWWGSMLPRTPSANVIVQPMNRGTANGILLPLLLNIEARDPDVCADRESSPSDHYVRDEPVLVTALGQSPALGRLDNEDRRNHLVGNSPGASGLPIFGYGIIPDLADGLGFSRVDRFVEKPSGVTLARHLVEEREDCGMRSYWLRVRGHYLAFLRVGIIMFWPRCSQLLVATVVGPTIRIRCLKFIGSCP